MNRWSKGSHGNLQTTQAIAKAIDCSPQTDIKALFLKTPTQFIERGEVKLLRAHSLHPYRPSQLVPEVTLHATKGEMQNVNPTTNALIYNDGLPVKYARATAAQRL